MRQSWTRPMWWPIVGAAVAAGGALVAVGVLAGASSAMTNGGNAPAVTGTPTISAPADRIVGEADSTVDFAVTLSASSASTVSVNYATANSSAFSSAGCFSNAQSYVSVSGTLNFAPGETSKTVPITINDCPSAVHFESFTLGLSGAVNATIARASTRIGIVDNDTVVATPRVFVRDATVDSKDGFALVPVLLGGPNGQASSSTVTVDYATSNGTASAGTDYSAVSGTLSFAPGQTVKTIAVPISDNGLAEPAQQFGVVLSNPSNATIADGKGTVTIGAHGGSLVGSPLISAPADRIVGEGDGYVDLAVTLSAPSASAVSVNYATANSSAFTGTGCFSNAQAYVGVSGTLNFAPGETTKVVRVDINDCTSDVTFESFTFGLSTATNASIQRASTRIGIVDNDTVVATPRVFVRDATVDSKDGFALVPVLLGGPNGQASSSTVTVDYATSNGTASAGTDYSAVSGTLSFAPGQTVKTIAVPISDNGLAEPAQQFGVVLSNPSNATIADGKGTVTIGAHGGSLVGSPLISAPADRIVGEGDGYVDLAVTLSAPSASAVSVNYATANSSAFTGTGCFSNAQAYVGVSGTLNFAPGETTKVVRVDINDCTSDVTFESFTFGLSTATNASIQRASTRIGIVDNDTVVATPRVFVRDATVDSKDGFALVPVLLGGPNGQASSSTVTVDYATSNGTASAGTDYSAVSGTLSFAPGQTVKTIAVPISDNGLAEPAQQFGVVLSNPSNATIADGKGTVTIGAHGGSLVGSPLISAPADRIVGEGDGYVDLAVTLSAPSASAVSVNYATANSSAFTGTGCFSNAQAYVGVSGTLNFAPGETTKVVRVDINDCTSDVTFESFTFGLSTATNASIQRASTRIGIVDNDTVVATPQLTVRDATVDEKDGVALVPVLLGNTDGQASNSTVTVDYATSNGTAQAGTDYAAVSGTLSFAPGQTVKTILVPITDEGSDATETFTVNLSNASNATIADGSGLVAIGASNATPVANPSISATRNMMVREVDGYIDLPVTLSAPGTGSVSVDYATANGTAFSSTGCFSNAQAYVGVSGTLKFAPGETTKVVRVDINDCPNVSPLETFAFQLSNAVNGTIVRASATVLIIEGSGSLSSVAVTPANPSITTGSDQQFTATGTFSDAETFDLTTYVDWASDNTAVAPIGADGLAHGVAAGTSTISATVLGVGDSTLLTVTGLTPQTISFAPLPGKTYGDADFTVSATASSGLPVSFGASGNCMVSAATVHLTGAGSCTITASQAGDATYAAATPVPQTFAIAKASQTISFGALADRTFGAPDFTVGATASSGLAVSFGASGSCTVSGATVHLSGAGSCTVTASQAGDANYNAAPSVEQAFSIAKAGQTISFGALADKSFGASDFTVGATASSGLAVSFGTSGSCTVSGATVHLTAAGSCTITASQAGNANYNAAAPVSQTFSIAKADQTISFGSLADKTFGDPDFTVSATASSGLSVSFAASGSCTASGATVHLTATGSCTITASQAGNANFNAAASVSRTFSISAQPKPPKTCKVPKVVGKRLNAAKRAIRGAHCTVGKVKQAYSRKRRGLVISQSRRAGKVVPINTRINLVVSRGRKR